jgi:hypothetical protein
MIAYLARKFERRRRAGAALLIKADYKNQGAWFDMMIVPLAANMPPTPWQTEILASGICAGAMPRI